MELSERMKPIIDEIKKDEQTLADLKAVERVLFGSPKEEKPAEGEPLKWNAMKADNHFVKSLKDMVNLYAHVVKNEVLTAEKNIKQARKVFNGR